MHDDTITIGSGPNDDTVAICAGEGGLHVCKRDIEKLTVISVVRRR
ncbi:hypothetical protein BOSE62_40263 [Bosea sp. 62]|nr:MULTISPECIES: hypothetical protein [unclassified Bosea (in: a-proteobacteria)]CAD5258581.1 hypothetical protein BOSE46_120525 [Bosea sp. 46]CAD5263019.1 hypothetical protein BOSE21B_110756 [Bosea sp. 21B]CAD5277360.1 hypothetical protein BOSE7B_40462 [Bosea sp. 7B]VVT58878.1 hypothetical protein BOS5A_200805 [Bosea sp. EC-HK365B]VXB62228.1 hypothetical protein BOSE29B_110688 [Bosea sp. 29B]